VSRILVQTTIADAADDWHVGRFSLLVDELRRCGHQVTARNRTGCADDPVLSRLDELDVDQLWLLAVDAGGGLSPADAAGIVRFRRRGGGVVTARDHHDVGSSLRMLGSIGRINHFHTENPERNARRDDQDNPGISWPNYHSGANGDYQRVFVDEPVHELLRTDRTASGHIEWFPAHPHEGAVSVPDHCPYATVVARGRSVVTRRPFNLAVALDGDVEDDGQPLGRAVACSTFHHFADMNWCVRLGAPSFVTDAPGHEIERDPERFDVFTGYVRNLAQWLDTPSGDGGR
jgi:hypothetical protein